VDGSCRAPCTSSTSCSTGSVCKIGYCMPSETPSSNQACTVSCDCPSGERCLDGYCRL
jgi:Cys-rich repeat protein